MASSSFPFEPETQLYNNIKYIENDDNFILQGQDKITLKDETIDIEYKTIASHDMSTVLESIKPSFNEIVSILNSIKSFDNISNIPRQNALIIKNSVEQLIINKLQNTNFDDILIPTMFKKYFFKYLSCFYNTNIGTETTETYNKFYMGVTDNGIPSGIPIKDISVVYSWINNFVHNIDLIKKYMLVNPADYIEYIKNIQISLVELNPSKHQIYMKTLLDSKFEDIHDPVNQIFNLIYHHKREISHTNRIRNYFYENINYITDRFYYNVDREPLRPEHIKNYLDHMLFYFMLGVRSDLRQIFYEQDDLYDISVNPDDQSDIHININYDNILKTLYIFKDLKDYELMESGKVFDAGYYVDKINSIRHIDFNKIFTSRQEISFLTNVIYDHYIQKLKIYSEKFPLADFEKEYQKLSIKRFESLYKLINKIGYKFYVIEIMFPKPTQTKRDPWILLESTNINEESIVNQNKYLRILNKNKQYSCLGQKIKDPL